MGRTVFMMLDTVGNCPLIYTPVLNYDIRIHDIGTRTYGVLTSTYTISICTYYNLQYILYMYIYIIYK